MIKWDKEYKTKRQVQIEYRYYTTSGKTHKTMEVWKKYKFGDVVQFNPTERMQKGTIAKKISMEKLLSNSRSIAGYEFENFMGGTKFRNGDTLMARITPCLENGKIAYVSLLDKNEVGFGSTEFIVFRAIEGITDAKFVYYFVSNPWFRDIAIKSMVGSSGRQRVQQGVLKNLEIVLPPLSEQKRIAGVLSALDDKIELNRRINANLEAQAMTLYKQWFVDGRQEDWDERKLGDIVDIYDSLRKPLSGQQREKMAKIYPYYGAASLMDYVENYIFDGIYLLLGEDGTVSDENGYPSLQYVWGKFWVNNHAHVLTGKNGYSTEMLYILLKQTNIHSIITGAVQPKINQANLLNLPVVCPPKDILDKYNEVIQPLFTQLRINREQIKNLSTLRDILLPKLMGHNTY